MKILIIATENSKSKQLMYGISTQGYEFLDNPFKIDEYENNWFNFENYFKTNKFVVKMTILHKPSSIPNYIVFISQFISQFDKIILLDKIIEDTNKHNDKRHKEILKKISEMINIPITYSLEEKPLGTAGPLNLIFNQLEENFIVLNGDLLTTIDFGNLFNAHLQSDASATIATFKRTVDIDFGVLEVDSKNKLINYKEKPSLDYKVSMGINVFKKNKVEDFLKNTEYLDIPDLMMKLKNNGDEILCHYDDCMWLDIGRIDDYSIATKIFAENKEKFLPKT